MFSAARRTASAAGKPAAKTNNKMVEFNQSGYIGISRSCRAKKAYEGGEKPSSKWTKEALLEGIAEAFGEDVAEKAKKLGKLELINNFLKKTSWHHVGIFATKIWFYEIAEDRTAEEASRLVDQLIEEKAGKKAGKKEDNFTFLVLTRKKNISNYRKWPKWKNFTYFCILKNDEKKARVIAGNDNDQTKNIYGLHIVDKAFFKNRKEFITAIKKYFNLRKIGSFSKKIDEILKK